MSSGVRVVSFAQKGYERILSFLYPSYSIMAHPMVCSEFITWRDIVDRSERETLDYEYSNCVFISKRLFDELWTEDVIIREVLAFARDRLGSRKRVFRPLAKEGDAFIDECIRFMFTGECDVESDDSVLQLFDMYGSSQFQGQFVSLCNERGVRYILKGMSTFLSRVLYGSDSLYYKKAGLRLRGSLVPNVESCVLSYQGVGAYFKRYFSDLSYLWYFMTLCRKNYF